MKIKMNMVVCDGPILAKSFVHLVVEIYLINYFGLCLMVDPGCMEIHRRWSLLFFCGTGV
jgi:hypothetical protein